MSEKEQNELLEKIKSEVSKELGKVETVSKKDTQDMIDNALENIKGVDPEKMKEIEKSITDLTEFASKVKNDSRFQKGGDEPKGYKQVIKEAFSKEDLAEKLQNTKNARHGVVDIIKAVGPVTTANATTTTGGNAILDTMNADDIREIGLRDTWIENYATVSRTSSPVYPYTEWVPGEGDAAFVAEGALKPQIDLDLSTRVLTPNKVAAYEILTDEAIQDIPRMESQSRTYILNKVMLKKQNGIIFGDGTGANPLGITQIAQSFDATSWPTDIANGEFNTYAGIVAAMNQISLAENYTDDVDYSANLVIMNPADVSYLKLQRDSANGGYLFPTISLNGDNTVEGLRVIAKKEIPAGSVLVGDFSKLHIVNYIDYSLQVGWINDQFIRNQFTMLGESRFYSYVKNLDQIAFVYDTFANIQAAIESV